MHKNSLPQNFYTYYHIQLHCKAGHKTGFQGLDLPFKQLNSNKIFKAVLFELIGILLQF